MTVWKRANSFWDLDELASEPDNDVVLGRKSSAMRWSASHTPRRVTSLVRAAEKTDPIRKQRTSSLGSRSHVPAPGQSNQDKESVPKIRYPKISSRVKV